MNNIELSEKIGAYLKGSKAKAKKFKELVAVHFNLLDVSENMYIEVKDGAVSVMPYEYIDKQATVTASTETLDKLFSGALSMDDAIANGYVKVEGDIEKFKALAALIPAAKVEKDAAMAPAKKACAKKPAAKKEAAPKAEAKPAAKSKK
ncbi:MAG: SCP2 sterol-binding domain-containing protein [Ruminococcaceae bacterium]|nr:SCP2 sterol-binding domain-containing protein [Oscillospiraceae bacterium]